MAPQDELCRECGGNGVIKIHHAQRYKYMLRWVNEQLASPVALDKEKAVTRIVQRVAELPDRTSPDDWPDAMLVTADELARIVREELASPDALDPPQEKA